MNPAPVVIERVTQDDLHNKRRHLLKTSGLTWEELLKKRTEGTWTVAERDIIDEIEMLELLIRN